MRLPPLAIAVSTARTLGTAAGPAPSQLTLDQLRSDLSHETAAKLARLAGLFREWRAGRYRRDDAGDAAAILRDIRELHLRHARVASGRLDTFAHMVRILALAHEMRRSVTCPSAKDLPAAATILRLEGLLADLTAASRHLVESLSSRYGVRFGEIVGAVAEEIRREAAAAEVQGVPVVIDSADGGAATWIPRSAGAAWADLLRNLIRNAVQATEERFAAGGGDDPPPVTVRLRPAAGKGGACLEILDEGLGMSPAESAAMWRDGQSRHGDGHGQGLTAGKRAFLARHAALEVRSVPGVGTCVRIEMGHRDIGLRPPYRWASPPLVLPAAALALGLVVLVAQTTRSTLSSVEVRDDHLVFGLDRKGNELWQCEYQEGVEKNWHSMISRSGYLSTFTVPYPILKGPRTGGPLVVLPICPGQGSGRVVALDAKGRERWSHTLSWAPPGEVHAAYLSSFFVVATTWNEGGRPAIALNVRQRNWGSTAIQFFSPQGDSLGSYYHPGHLEFVQSGDIDGDGRIEIVLRGKNNDATQRTVYWPQDAGADAYGECLVMLESPQVNGQGFPYRRWNGMAPAREEAYLLIPPLREEALSTAGSLEIHIMSFGNPRTDGKAQIEVFMVDGRIYQLDGRLRPLSCGVGDRTDAARMAPTRPAGPLVYITDGRIETIDLAIRRESR